MVFTLCLVTGQRLALMLPVSKQGEFVNATFALAALTDGHRPKCQRLSAPIDFYICNALRRQRCRRKNRRSAHRGGRLDVLMKHLSGSAQHVTQGVHWILRCRWHWAAQRLWLNGHVLAARLRALAHLFGDFSNGPVSVESATHDAPPNFGPATVSLTAGIIRSCAWCRRVKSSLDSSCPAASKSAARTTTKTSSRSARISAAAWL